MPFLIRSKGAPAGEVVSDRDKELLGMWNCLNPGIRGLFDVPESNFMKVFILASACFCFYCTLIDFTVAVCAPDIFEAMEPMDRGTFKELIYCFDVVFMVELAISICVKVHKSGGPTRSTVLIVIEVISAIPYELMYVILKGKSHHVFYTFRMRYSLRFLRFFMESAGENFDLSLLLLKYMFASSIMCVVVCSIRIYYCYPSKMDPDKKSVDEYPNRIAGLFKDRNVLITGGTGFMGKVLVEKLLRTCPDLKHIYLIIRFKKGKSGPERLKDLFASPLFDMLRDQRGPEVFEKVIAIEGDVSAVGLGLSDVDRQTLQEEVHYMYHCAASVRFDEPLKRAVLLNVRGTKQMLDLAHETKNLLLFCHVSTAYCHLHERVLYEKPYAPPASPLHVIKTVEWMDEDIVEQITPKILGEWPNTYAFTKALGEGLVNEELDKLPIILLRPSVIIPIWKEPLPGWTDNINGPTGLLIGAGKGIIRTMYCNSSRYADYLPVDIAINGLLCASSDYLSSKERQIFNLTSSAEYKISWEEIIEIGREVINTRIPLNWVVWYPGGSMKRSRLVHNLCVLFFHLVPAVFLDFLLICMGYKPVLLKIQKRILKGFEMFEYYANNQWDFNNDHSLLAREKMNPKEKQVYILHGDGINYHDYFTDCVLSARRYILKENDESIPTARRHMKLMYCVDRFFKLLFFCGMIYLLYQKVAKPLLNL